MAELSGEIDALISDNPFGGSPELDSLEAEQSKLMEQYAELYKADNPLATQEEIANSLKPEMVTDDEFDYLAGEIGEDLSKLKEKLRKNPRTEGVQGESQTTVDASSVWAGLNGGDTSSEQLGLPSAETIGLPAGNQNNVTITNDEFDSIADDLGKSLSKLKERLKRNPNTEEVQGENQTVVDASSVWAGLNGGDAKEATAVATKEDVDLSGKSLEEISDGLSAPVELVDEVSQNGAVAQKGEDYGLDIEAFTDLASINAELKRIKGILDNSFGDSALEQKQAILEEEYARLLKQQQYQAEQAVNDYKKAVKKNMDSADESAYKVRTGINALMDVIDSISGLRSTTTVLESVIDNFSKAEGKKQLVIADMEQQNKGNSLGEQYGDLHHQLEQANAAEKASLDVLNQVISNTFKTGMDRNNESLIELSERLRNVYKMFSAAVEDFETGIKKTKDAGKNVDTSAQTESGYIGNYDYFGTGASVTGNSDNQMTLGNQEAQDTSGSRKYDTLEAATSRLKELNSLITVMSAFNDINSEIAKLEAEREALYKQYPELLEKSQQSTSSSMDTKNEEDITLKDADEVVPTVDTQEKQDETITPKVEEETKGISADAKAQEDVSDLQGKSGVVEQESTNDNQTPTTKKYDSIEELEDRINEIENRLENASPFSDVDYESLLKEREDLYSQYGELLHTLYPTLSDSEIEAQIGLLDDDLSQLSNGMDQETGDSSLHEQNGELEQASQHDSQVIEEAQELIEDIQEDAELPNIEEIGLQEQNGETAQDSQQDLATKGEQELIEDTQEDAKLQDVKDIDLHNQSGEIEQLADNGVRINERVDLKQTPEYPKAPSSNNGGLSQQTRQTLDYAVQVINNKVDEFGNRSNGLERLKRYLERNNSAELTRTGDVRNRVSQISELEIEEYLNQHGVTVDRSSRLTDDYKNVLDNAVRIMNERGYDGLYQLREYLENCNKTLLTNTGDVRNTVSIIPDIIIEEYLSQRGVEIDRGIRNTNYNRIISNSNNNNNNNNNNANQQASGPSRNDILKAKLENMVYLKPNDFFESVRNETNASYGVDQDAIYDLCTFTDDHGRTYTFRQANKAINDAIKNKQPIPNMNKEGNSEYFKIRTFIMEKYGLTQKEASIILSATDNTGACSYAEFCNEIFVSYQGKSDLFEKDFGFPMYTEYAGEVKPNYAQLIADLYAFANSSENGGNLLKRKFDGTHKLNTHSMSNEVDALGRTLLNSDKQRYISTSFGQNKAVINKYLKSNGGKTDYISTLLVPLSKRVNSNDMNNIASRVSNGILDGRQYSLGVYVKGNGTIRFKSLDPSRVGDSFMNSGGHAIYVTGVTNEGFVVSSWGYKYLVSFDELMKNEVSFDLSESIINIK